MPSATATSLPERLASVAASRTAPARPTAVAPLRAQRVQAREALLVALAPRGHAVAQPVLLHDDLAAELVAVALLLLERLVAPGLEMREAAVHAAGDAAVQPHHGAAERLQQPAVVADQHQGASAGWPAPPPARRSPAGRDGWSARRAAGCRAPGRVPGPGRRGGPRRRRAAPGPRCRSGRAGSAVRRRGAGRRSRSSPAST